MCNSLELRFWSIVDKDGTIVNPELGNCWIWTRSGSRNGYGCISINNKTYNAHRVAYELTYGKIENPKLYVCHKCDNKLCVRPTHLFLGTSSDNQLDCESKHRRKHQGEYAGVHKLKSDDVLSILDRYKNGERVRDIHKDYKHLVVYSTISDICSGNNWSCLKNK